MLNSDFDGPSLDTSIWRTGWFGTGITGPVNTAERACYSSHNVSLPGDGTLHLDVTDTSATCQGTTEPYTGALISSNPDDGRTGGGFQYTYGVLEAKVYVPPTDALIENWPAVWADGQHWPTNGEDDVMEGLGGLACFHFITPAGNPGQCRAAITPGWHTFASDWEPGSVTYYYDGTDVGSITSNITSSPMYIVLDNTVDGNHPLLSGPSVMQVAYVRVWQHD